MATRVKDGFRLTHFDRDPIVVSAAQFNFYEGPDADALAMADIVIICVKSQDSAEAAASIAPHINDDTLVISFQNGLRNKPTLDNGLAGQGIVLGAVVPFNVTRTEAATWHCGTEGGVTIQAHDDRRLTELKEAFARAGHSVTMSDDITAVQWGKLLVNLNNGLNALSGGTLLSGLMQRPYRLVLAAMIAEAIDILNKAGITPAAFGKASPQKMLKILPLPNWIYAIIMNRIVKIDPSARSSMLDDLDSGRPCEIEYLQGEIVALARSVGLSAPINARVQSLVEEAFAAGRSPKMSGTEIYSAVMDSA